jgi:hypothetical protein
MQMMKAAVVHEFGKPLVIEEVSVPEVVPGQVRDWQTEGLQWALSSISADLIAATRFALDAETKTGYVCTTLIPVVEGEISLLPG